MRLRVPFVALHLHPLTFRICSNACSGEHSLELARRRLHPTMQDLPEVIGAAEAGGRLRGRHLTSTMSTSKTRYVLAARRSRVTRGTSCASATAPTRAS